MSDPIVPFGSTPKGWPVSSFHQGGHLHFLHLFKCSGTSIRLVMVNCFNGRKSHQILAKFHQYLRLKEFAGASDLLYVADYSASHTGPVIFNQGLPSLNVFTWLQDPLDTLLSSVYFSLQQATREASKYQRPLSPAHTLIHSATSPFDAVMKLVDAPNLTGPE